MSKKNSYIRIAVAASLASSLLSGANPACPPKSPSASSAATNQPAPKKSCWECETLTGDWGGLRTQLGDKGFTLSASYTAEVFGNTGGDFQHAVSDGLFGICLDIDLEKLTGSWKNATIHTNMLYIYGTQPSVSSMGDLTSISNIAGYNSVRLQELWLQQQFFDRHFFVRAGLITADGYFFSADTACLFINGTFGANPLVANDLVDFPQYPTANPAVLLGFEPTKNFYFRTAVFGVNQNANPAGNNAHGAYWDINKSDGALLSFELGWLRNHEPDATEFVATYKLGAFVQHGFYTTWQSQAATALGVRNPSPVGTNYVVYGVIDHEIYKRDGRKISVFGRGGFAPSTYSTVSGYYDVGFNFSGFVQGRQGDLAGVAFAQSLLSKDFSDSQQLQGGPAYTSQMVIEATYKVQICPWWSIQPDLQYIVRPSGAQNSNNAFVVGLRTSIAF